MRRKYLAVIPARGGSKGIPGKNIKIMNGKPLLEYTVDVAMRGLNDGFIEKVVLSTDSPQIADVASECGLPVPFLRPVELGGDAVKTVDVINYVLEKLTYQGEQYDAVVTLQPTSPQRSYEDLKNAIQQFDCAENDSLISVYLDRKANGYNYYEKKGSIGYPLHKEHNKGIRRQDMPDIFVRNGAIYISLVELLNEKNEIIGNTPELYVMPKERSIDIDSLLDFDYVEFLMWKAEQL